ncbi:uncharacterized protein LOC125031219 [Penaeus chinensis]|uniref:uncharacterized protein LOC125031219 n=1 Tax=Penaeus chinensis TaxID=139456 RepID=UPI001FB63472|nr:uncharacterized protein LOC125031219 [Penaeus chinensis]
MKKYLCCIFIVGLVEGSMPQTTTSEAIRPHAQFLTQPTEGVLRGRPSGQGDSTLAAEGRNGARAIQPIYTKDPNATITFAPNNISDSTVERLWVLDLGGARGYGIELNVTRLNLLVPVRIHDAEEKKDVSNGDFLLVGPGRKILGSTEEKLLWGVVNKTIPLHVSAPVAHVYFRFEHLAATNTSSEDPVFEIHYRRTGTPITTPDPSVTTTTLPPPPVNLTVSSWVALNGISPTVAQEEEYLLSVRQITANIANQYAASNNMKLQDEIREEDVILQSVKTCHPLYCWANCAAYNVSVRAYYVSDGSWAFIGDILRQMFADRQYDHYWEDAKYPARVCVEAPIEGRGEWDTWLVAASVTALALLIFILVWKIQRYNAMAEMQKDFEKQQLEMEKERARRMSGDISILGLGTWGNSVASRDSRRHSLPFPRMRMDSRFSEEEEDDVSEEDFHGYQEFIPDRIIMDATVLGLEAELDRDNRDGSYFNAAFVDDEGKTGHKADDEDILYERRPSPVTMDSDSDDPDAINFRSYSKSHSAVRKVSTTAEIHDDETSL